MKKLFIILLVVALAMPAFALKFKDMPDNHWAASSVYDLVNLGVTQGYPDGTFRGKKYITRYETAVFLAKLASALGADASSGVGSDIKALKAEIAALRKSPGSMGGGGISGDVEMSGKLGNLFATKGNTKRGPVVNYRLRTSIARDLGEGASVKVNMDTMDAGFAGATQDLATRMIDIEGNLKVDMGLENPVDVKVTAGPGNITHTDATGALAAENGETFFRPYNGISASTSMSGIEMSGGYVARSMVAGNTGEIETNLIEGKLGYTLTDVPMIGMLKVEGGGAYYAQNPMATTPGPRDLTGMVAASAALAPKIQASAKLGLGGSETRNWLAGANLALADIWDTGTIINVQVTKVGQEYMNTTLSDDLAGYDVFNRKLVNGSVDLGGEVVQSVTDRVMLKGKGDLRLSGDYQYGEGKANSQLTVQGGVSYDIAPATSVDALYRILQDPNATDKTTDMAAVGLMYRF